MERCPYTEPQKALIKEYDKNLASQIALVQGYFEVLYQNGAPVSHSYVDATQKYKPFTPVLAARDVRLRGRSPYMPISAMTESTAFTMNSYLNHFFRRCYKGSGRAPKAESLYVLPPNVIDQYAQNEQAESYISTHRDRMLELGGEYHMHLSAVNGSGVSRIGDRRGENQATTISSGFGTALRMIPHLVAVYGASGIQESRFAARTQLDEVITQDKALGTTDIFRIYGNSQRHGAQEGDKLGPDKIDRPFLRGIRSTTGGCPADWVTNESAALFHPETTPMDLFVGRVAHLYETTVVPWWSNLPATQRARIWPSERRLLERGEQARLITS